MRMLDTCVFTVFPTVVPGYELYANLTVALLGLVLVVAARIRPSA